MASSLILCTLSLLFLTTCAFDILEVLNASNCNTFSSVIYQTGVIEIYEKTAQNGKGLTIFAPSDDAFKEQGAPDWKKSSNARLIKLLEYHAIPKYIPNATLKNVTEDQIATLAENPLGKYELRIKTGGRGENITLETGVNSANIIKTAINEIPVSIFVVDRILLSKEDNPNVTVTAPTPSSGDNSPDQVPPPKKKSNAVKVAGGLKAVVAVAVTLIVTVFLS